eukprot:TRINITY_DN51_c0_g1_i1.p1 TRINITY_DN51_c0_g1~~TRINITY_DN51_c0_g1_i1.p1  ORF type:complete len:280 (-),score=89.90 TRINITY_DN51_c0_g1_i1:865-1704(-)
MSNYGAISNNSGNYSNSGYSDGYYNNNNNNTYGYSGSKNVLLEAQQKIQKLNTCSSRIEALTRQVNTPADSKQIRNDLKYEREQALSIIREIQSDLSQPVDLNEQATKATVSKEFEKAIPYCKEVISNAILKTKNFPLQARIHQQQAHQNALNLANQMDDQIFDESKLQEIDEVNELEIDNVIIKSRNEDLKKAAQELEALQELSKDASLLIDSQTKFFVEAEKNTNRAERQTQIAVNHLQSAAKMQRGSRTKQCFILTLIIGSILVVTFLVILFYVVL